MKQSTYLILLLFIFSYCSKEEAPPPALSPEEQLVSATWQLNKIQIQIPPDAGLTDVINQQLIYLVRQPGTFLI